MTDAKPSEKEAPKQEESTNAKLVLIKKGDYQIHILLEEIKNWEQKEDANPPYSTVKVECFGKSQRTEKTDLACTNYVYDEHFYFEKTNLTVEQLCLGIYLICIIPYIILYLSGELVNPFNWI